MTKFAIELPNTYAVVSRSIGVEAKLDKLSPEIIAKLALHGLTQKIGDSAASALKDAGFEGQKFKDLSEADKVKVNDFAKAAMAATLEALEKGEWSERRAGAGSVDPVVQRIRVLFGALLREQAKDVWATVKDLEPKDKAERLDALFATQDEAFQTAMAGDAKEQLEAEAKARAKVAKLTVKIAL